MYNVDGIPNEAGAISGIVNLVLRYKGHTERAQFAITGLGKQDLILGYTWLREHNPEVNWQTNKVKMSHCPTKCCTYTEEEKVEQCAEAGRIQACCTGPMPSVDDDLRNDPDLSPDPDDDDDDPPDNDDTPIDDDDLPLEEGDRIFTVHFGDEVEQVRATQNISHLLRPDLFTIRALEALACEGEERDILHDIRKGNRTGACEDTVAHAASELNKFSGKSLRSAEWRESQDLLYFRNRIYVPKNANLRRWIVEQHHDMRIAGHAGQWKTLELVSHNSWWPQMSRYIGEYCKTCNLCLQTKVQWQLPIGELKSLLIPQCHWDAVSVDFIVELPESEGYDTIMVVVDTVGKCAHFIEMHTMVTALGATCLYLHNVWRHHGLQKIMISNHRSQFVAEFTHELYCLLRIKITALTAYHLQTDGQTKHVNQELKQYLHLFVSECQDNWKELLPRTEFQYNNHVHASTQHSPFLLDTGRHPCMGFEPHAEPSHVEAVNEFTDHMCSTLVEAKAALTKAKDDMVQYYNRRH